MLLGSTPAGASFHATPGGNLWICQNKAQVEARKYVDKQVKAVAACLNALSREIVGKNLPATAPAIAAPTCVTQFRKLYDTRATPQDLATKMRARIEKKCDPAVTPTLLHMEQDIIDEMGGGTSPQDLNVSDQLTHVCGGFDEDGAITGAITDLDEWIDCLQDAGDVAARAVISAQWPRALEWLDLVVAGMATVPAPASDPSRTSDALAGLGALEAALEGIGNDDVPFPRAAVQLPATGQTTSYGTGDDGDVKAGTGKRYVDNGDGTITDLNTGLMWEKKDDNNAGGIHDYDNLYTWCEDIDATPGVCDNAGNPFDGTVVTDFLYTLNDIGGGGASCFAGYCDWRLPNVSELQSILNYGSSAPAVHDAFNTACGSTCTVATCSCTKIDNHWSASTYHAAPTLAWYVKFGDGSVDSDYKYLTAWVRAVRGGLSAP
jgi:hypothetical protein